MATEFEDSGHDFFPCMIPLKSLLLLDHDPKELHTYPDIFNVSCK
jgi:hypothetical protein